MNATDRAVPRLALRPEEVCRALGVSPDFFAAHVADDLRVVRRGRVKLYPVFAIERWLEENAAITLERDR